MTQDQPNILWIMTDQQRYDTLSALGHPVLKTPNLDRLAQSGITFTDAYTPCPVCGPARAAMFTGRFPPGCGVVNNWAPFNGRDVHLAERLQHAGYDTAMVGKLHFVPHRKRFGFARKALNDLPGNIYANDAEFSDYVTHLRHTLYQHDPDEPVRRFDDDERQVFGGDMKRFMLGSNFIPESHHMTTWTAEQTIQTLRERHPDRPFFVFSSFFGPHQPYAVPGQWNGLHDPAEIDLSETEVDMSNHPVFPAGKKQKRFGNLSADDMRQCIAAYYDNIAMLDHYIGQVLDELRRQGIWDDTIIVFCSDHGDHAGRYGMFFKGDMYDSAVRVPLIVKPAGGDRGEQCPTVVSTLDLYATLLELAGTDAADDTELESKSFTGLLADPHHGGPGRACAIIGSDPDSALTMYREGNWKMLRQACGPEEAKYELYDRSAETIEQHDRFADDQATEPRDRLQSALDAWYQNQRNRYPATVHSYATV